MLNIISGLNDRVWTSNGRKSRYVGSMSFNAKMAAGGEVHTGRHTTV